ncbi:DUF6790 family protein [Clostridium estertheticum]|uniref:DUF6790 family protein n=1 Tax=Clostridium estertheticum TaxID=238834 RepID=UPI001CF38F6C|nr:DUF6790 family protein [Clostridium estertheticum]MCB2356509.1 hypothetical protein [Clostridium estertheticum]WAG43806.1 hypothetical protein LL065_24325 [Clostridium estertheticum]
MERKNGLFKISVVLFFYICPVISILIDMLVFKEFVLVQVILKWCVFGGVGLRLFTAGLKQALTPEFTSKSIFDVTDVKAFPIVRELGFANICFGFIGIISLFMFNFRLVAAIIGVLYYSLALFQHLIREKKNSTEMFVTITDLSIVLELGIPLLIILL